MISRWLVSGLGMVGTVISFQLFAATATQVDSSEHAEVEPAHKRPTVALVLAGGGAKGAAHIGVLKALEEMQIPVDYITGTSMGSYVGGLYATGMSADEIESFIYTVDWKQGYRDRVNRSDRRIRDKEYEDRYQLNTDLGLGWEEIKARKGVVQGQNMLRILRETTGNLSPLDSFDDLAIPFRSVATDIIELEEVVIDHGHLVDAMMASMSVPGALPPYEVDGRMLVDGGVTNNMPVDVARAMGADIIIAVDISTNYKGKEDFTTFLAAADQLSNYLVQRSTEEQAETLKDNDVFLQPDVGEMETTEFDKMPSAYEAGYESAKQHSAELSKLSLSNADYQHYIEDKQKARRQLKHGDKTVVDKVVINNNTHYSDKLLENRLNLHSGKVLKTSEIEAKVQDLYALDRFELITYEFDNVDGEEQLTVDVNEKSWGPNYLNFRFFLEDDFSTDSQYSLGASANFTDLNAHGAELRTNLEMGTDKRIEAELFSPFFSSQKLFTSASVTYSKQNRNLSIGSQEIAEPTLDVTENYLSLTYSEYIGEFAIGYQPNLWQELRFGVRYKNGQVSMASLPGFGGGDYTRLGGFIRYRLDTLDDFNLPTEGHFVDLEYFVSHDDFENDDNGTYEPDLASQSDTVYEFSANLMVAKSYERHTFVGRADYGVVESKNSIFPIDPKELGGFLNLSGIPRNSLIGQNLAYTSLIYRYRWFDNDFGLFESPFYVGASLEYGGVWSNNNLTFDEAPVYAAGSVFAGIDSPIGPIILAYGRTEDNFDSVYLIVGTSYK